MSNVLKLPKNIKLEGGCDIRATYRLYRHFGSNNELLYIGISLSAFSRLSQHREYSRWFSEITRVEFHSYDSREAALKAERDAILAEQPKYNIHHKNSRFKQHVKDVDSNAELSRKNIVERLVVYKPVYNLMEAAAALQLGPTRLRQLVNTGEIRSFSIGNSRLRITGWALIEYLEAQ